MIYKDLYLVYYKASKYTDQKIINELEKKAGIEIFKEKNILTKNGVMQQ